MTTWHGYEQSPDTMPGRPWWRRCPCSCPDCRAWVRTDGRRDTIPEVADREDPLPAPDPKVGQVWVCPGCWEQSVVGVLPKSGIVVWGVDGEQARDWPPVGAVLVAGPGAPWAPVEER